VMGIRELLKDNPERFVTRSKIWTPKRSTIETEFSHGELVGTLLVYLSCRDGPLNDKEETAMKRLLKVFRETHDKLEEEDD